MKSVFILQHSYERDSCDETKFIGVYTSSEQAELAIKRLSLQPGFKDRIENFSIDEYELNKDHWTEGFASVVHIQVKDINGNWKTVGSDLLIDGNYQIVEYDDNDLLGEFKHNDVVKCEWKDGELYATELVKR